MTGAAPVLDRPALWAALSDMQIDLAGAGRFESVLAERQGWTAGFAERVTEEYRRFLYLAATARSEVTPSQAVDEAWHLHLASPHYEEGLCRQILESPIEHRPGTGEPEEEERYNRQYEETLALYEQVFAEPPPSDIWPRPIANAHLHAGPKTPRELGQRVCRGLAVGGLAGSVGALATGSPELAVFMAGVALVFFLGGLILGRPPHSRAASGCGGASCGGGGDGGGDGCASCGGGSCGGGCGGGGD